MEMETHRVKEKMLKLEKATKKERRMKNVKKVAEMDSLSNKIIEESEHKK